MSVPMNDWFVPSDNLVRHAYKVAFYGEPGIGAEFDRWLAARDAAVLKATLRQAARLLSARTVVSSTNGIGWVPTDSLLGAAHYLRHLARDEAVKS